MATQSTASELRILVLMPSARDGQRTADLLAQHGLSTTNCASLEALLNELPEGAGSILLTDEILGLDTGKRLAAALRAQPAWSALPVILLVREGRSQPGALGAYAHVVIVERPARVPSLISAVQSALRARKDQYRVRQAIAVREQQAAALLAQDEKLRFALSAGRLGSWELDPEALHYESSDICKANYG